MASRPVRAGERAVARRPPPASAEQVGHAVEVAQVDELGVAGDEIADLAMALSVMAGTSVAQPKVRSASSQ